MKPIFIRIQDIGCTDADRPNCYQARKFCEGLIDYLHCALLHSMFPGRLGGFFKLVLRLSCELSDRCSSAFYA
jgi:hypothetical protein